MVPSIHFRLRDTRSGRTELRYAASLAALTGGRLIVILPFDGDGHLLTELAWRVCQTTELAEAENDRVRGYLSGLGIDPARVELIGAMAGRPFTFPNDAILVGNDVRAEERRTHRIAPFDQSAPQSDSGALRIMIPFAGGPSGLRATEAAARFVRTIGGTIEIVLYHTTWPDPEVVSDVPALHMCKEVRKSLERIMASLDAFPQRRNLIEMTEDVPGGILRAALRQDVDLIVMARGAGTARGSYVDRVLSRSTVPVLIAPEEVSS